MESNGVCTISARAQQYLPGAVSYGRINLLFVTGNSILPYGHHLLLVFPGCESRKVPDGLDEPVGQISQCGTCAVGNSNPEQKIVTKEKEGVSLRTAWVVRGYMIHINKE